MKRGRKTFIPMLIGALFSLLVPAGNVRGQDEHPEYWRFVRTVEDILAGKDLEKASTAASQKAKLIHGPHFENLREVPAGGAKAVVLADTSYHGVMIQGETNPSEDMGVLVLKTTTTDGERVRFHTIVFRRDSSGQYKVNVWHAGE